VKIDLKIDGLKELDALVQSMPKNLAKKGIRRAVKRAHAVVYEAIRSRIEGLPNSGLLKRRSLKLAMLMAWRQRPARHRRAGTYAIDGYFEDPEAAGLVHYRRGAHTPLARDVPDRHGRLRRRRGAEVGRSFIPAALEFGHAAPGQAGGTKIAAAVPFMRPGIDQAKEPAGQVLEAEMKKELDDLVRQAGGQP